MALPDIDLRDGQKVVMNSLMTELGIRGDRILSAQKEYDDHFKVVDEYSNQVAQQLGLDVATQYTFDPLTRKFKDRAEAIAAAQAAVAKP